MASEACFSLDDHLQCVSMRLSRLNTANCESPADDKMRRFLDLHLRPLWKEITHQFLHIANQQDLGLNDEMRRDEKRISPSDFGFHNVLRRPDGRLCFLDFEYAGWDDPAKTVGDFFCQPAIPVPLTYFDMFADRVCTDQSSPKNEQLRMRLLLPIYQVKWVCILLNEFLPIDANRRTFAAKVDDLEQRKMTQLTKAKQAASRLAIRNEQIIVSSDQGEVITG